MRHDYDPAFDAAEDYGYDNIRKEMESRSSGRWEWDKAHLVFTGKDADLEPWGQQALELISVDEETVKFKLHYGASIAGDDVCLNLPREIEQDGSNEGWKRFDEIRQVYLDAAQEVVCGTGCDFGGYWSGDDWWIDYEVDLSVPVIIDDEGVPKVSEIVDAMEAAAQKDITYWEEELGMAHDILDQVAGWKDGDGNHVPSGAVIEGSAYSMWKQMKEEAEA